MRPNKSLFILLTLLLVSTNSLISFSRPLSAIEHKNKVKPNSDITVTPGKGIGNASLGMADSQALPALKNSLNLKLSASGIDKEYEGQTVYYYYFGNKDRNNDYPLQVYSDAKRKIFIFEINSSQFVTPEGIRIGSREEALRTAYGQVLKSRRTRLYTQYSLGSSKGTDFYVKNGVVTQILIRNY